MAQAPLGQASNDTISVIVVTLSNLANRVSLPINATVGDAFNKAGVDMGDGRYDLFCGSQEVTPEWSVQDGDVLTVVKSNTDAGIC